MRRIRLAGQLAEPISHYTDAVEAAGFLYISGMLSLDAAGDLVGAADVIRQSEQVLDNVGAVLTATGATFDDVVRVGVYVRDMADRELINTIRRRYFGDARPASTLVEVSALAHPDALVEIEAVALLPRRDRYEALRGLMAGPALLLLDEPMAGVNPSLARRIEQHLVDLCGEGITMFMIEHELAVVERLCDPVIVMAQARVISQGTMADIRADREVLDAYLIG